jgi:tetratricopeptide (TPR) repeat protein
MPSAYYNRGLAYYNQQKYAQAIADYNKAIELDPNDADAYYNRGIAYADQQEYAQAIADYNKAIELDPKYAYAYYNRGIAYYNQQKYAQAIADFNKTLLLLDPNDPFVATVKQNLQDAKNNKNTKY